MTTVFPVLTQLKEIANAVLFATEASELESVLQRIAEIACDLSRTRYAALGVPDGSGGLRFFRTVGMTPEEIAMMEHYPHGHGLIGAIMRERQTIRLERMQDDPRSVGFPQHHPVMVSLLGVPIQLADRLYGMFYLCDRSDGLPFDESDQLLMETLAGYAALAISSAEVSQQRHRLTLLEERERIGMELHDGIIQSLYGIGMQVDLLRSQNESILANELTPVIDNLNNVIEDIRSFILDLRHRGDRKTSVRKRLEQVMTRMHLPNTLSIRLEAPEALPPFSPVVFESICLIVNEALSNVARHANATEVHLKCVQDRSWFTLQIRDNGQGFDGTIDPTNERSGLGLHHMQRRARLYGGDLTVESQRGQGTQITIRIPLRTF